MARHETLSETLAHPMLDATTAFAAGAVGMLAQLIWVRVLVQWFGTSAITIASALAASLAGLAIGAYIFRRSTEGFRNWLGPVAQRPGWLLLTAGIAVMEGSILLFFPDMFLWGIQAGLPATAALLATAVMTLVPLNIALGGVLPTLIESARTRSTKSVGVLYGAETLGGAAGALVAGFWLIQSFGLIATLFSAGMVGIVVGATAVYFSRSELDVPDEEQIDANTISLGNSTAETSRVWQRKIVAAIFLAGVASLSMEIVWQRALILLVGTDTHSYMIVAVSYLVGVAFGSYLCSWVASTRANLFCVLQLGVAVTSLIALATFCKIASGDGQEWLMNASNGAEVIGKRFLASFALLILPSCLTGASFPAAVSILVRSGNASAEATGKVYATIATGNVAGVLLAGFLLIPLAGLQTSLIVLAGVAVGAAGLAASSWNFKFVLAGAAALATGCYLFMTQQPIGLNDLPVDQSVSYYREGPVNTVSVIVDSGQPIDGTVPKRMVVDGIVIGENIGGVDEKQQMLAHLPLLIHAMSGSDSTQNLNTISIGLGTGILAGEMAVQPSVKHVTCVELSTAVIEASNHFSDDNHQLAARQNATIRPGDGIHFLRRSNDLYDCIVSDGKSRPGHAGNVAFFSSDYYRIAAQRLTEFGTFAQWVSLEGSSEEVQTILKTFAQEFELSYVALAPPDSIYLIGRRSPIRWSEKRCDDYLQAANSLSAYGWRTSDDIRSMAWLDAKELTASLPADMGVNSLNRPILERFALDIFAPDAGYHKVHNLTFFEKQLSGGSGTKSVLSLAFDSDSNGNLPGIRDACLNLVQAAKILADPVNVDLSEAANFHQQALKNLPRISRGIDLADRILEQAEKLSGSISPAELASLLKQAASLAPVDAKLQMMIGSTLADRKHFDSAAGCFYRASQLQPENPEALVEFARCLIELRKFRAAARPLKTALKLQPDNERAKQLLQTATDRLAFP